jgi:UDP-glucose 4-epimerase
VYGEKQCFPVPEDAELEPKNAYGVSKMAGEAYCRIFRSAGLPVTILRLANVYGPGDRGRVIPIFVENALRGEPLVLYGGEQVVDFVWIATVLHAMERAIVMPPLEHPVNIGSGTGVTVRELAKTVIRKAQSSSTITEAPFRSFETRGYVAAVQKAVALGLMEPADNPLDHLDSVIRDFRVQLAEAGSVLANS